VANEDAEPGEYGPRHFFGILPVFLVDDVVATAEYYRDVLGFEVDFVYGDEPIYARVMRNDAIIDLSRSDPPGRRNGVSAAGPGNGVDALIVVSDIDELFEEFRERGAQIRHDIASHDYGMRDFQIEDANGYVLVFTEEIDA
jgi:uncharacterized glyoxalase superfamily protein PhnB